MRLKGKTALVTGASRGIGRATAELFADEGARVVINYRQGAAEAEAVAKSIGLGRAVAIQADVSTEAGARSLVAETVDALGGIDVLVNNAGVLFREPDWKSDIRTWRSTVETNLLGPWLVAREAAEAMSDHGGGAMVQVSSIYGLIGAAGALSYSASKGGLLTMTKALAKELAPTIRVNAVAPGNVLTEMTATAGAEAIAAFEAQTPLQRSARPEEIARAILFLASSDASFITGEVLVVDGGYTLR